MVTANKSLPSPLRSPLLWFMLPWILGIILSQKIHLPDSVIFPVLLILVFASLVLSGKEKLLFYWKICFCIAVTLLGMRYAQLRAPVADEFAGEPTAQNASFVARIDHIFNADQNGYFSGMITIKESPSHLHFCLEKQFYVKTRQFPKETPSIVSQEISFQAKVTFLDKENTLTDFDHFLLRRGSMGKMTYAKNIRQAKPANEFYRFFYFSADRCEKALRANIPANEQPLCDIYVGMLLGKKQMLSDDQKATFSQSGTFHLFAVSGLHVGVVAFFIYTTLYLLRIKDPYRSLVAIIPLFCYVGISGFSASATRAFLMILCYLIAGNIRRQQAPLPALLASAFIILIWQPSQVFDIGFQLSYLIVSAILLFALPLQNRLYDLCSGKIHKMRLHPLLAKSLDTSTRFIFCTLGISFAAMLAGMPLSLLYFSVLNPFSFLINALLITAASGVIILGMLSIAFSGFGTILLGSFFNYGAIFLIMLMTKGIDTFLYLFPFYPRTYTTPTVAWITVCGIFLSFFFAEKNNWNIPTRIIIPCIILTFSLILTTSIT